MPRSTPSPGDARTDYGLLARLVVATFMVVDALDYPYRVVVEGSPGGWAPGLHRLAGLVACLSLLWAWPRTAAAAAALTVGFVVARGHITGFELWWLPIALALSVARRRWVPAAVVAAVCAAFVAWTHEMEGRPAAVGVLALCAAGALAGAVLGAMAVSRGRSAEAADRLHADNLRLRHHERRQLAGDLRRATEGLFERARHTIDAAGPHASSDTLHEALLLVRGDVRASLATLRSLLAVLRADDLDASVAAEQQPPDRRTRASTLRTTRVAGAVILLLFAAGHLVGSLPGVTAPEVVLTLALGAAGLTFVRPVAGMLVATAVLAASVVTGGSPGIAALTVAALVGAAALAARSRPRLLWAAAVVAGYVVARTAVGGAGVLPDVAGAAGGAMVTSLAALALREQVDARRSARVAHDALTRERGAIARDERAALARELHDQLGHQLSVVALQVNAAEHVEDRDELQRVRHRIDRTLRAAAGELDQLVAAMTGTPLPGAPSGPLVTPTVAGRVMAATLTEHGHQAHITVDPGADALDPTTQLTLVRVLQEATTNVLRHAAPGGRVEGRVAVAGDVVEVEVVSAVPAPGLSPVLADHSTGLGLRGLFERVSASGGTATAGPLDGRWVVRVVLPRADDRVPPAAGAPADARPHVPRP